MPLIRKNAKDEGPARRIKVQIGVCKRMTKEVASYEREVKTNEAKIQKMKDEGRDEYDIRKQEEVLQESYMMVPDSKSRLGAAIDELNNLLEDSEGDESVPAELIEEARTVIAESSATA